MIKGAIKWRKMSVPEPLYTMLLSEAKREKIAMWKVVERAATFWRTSTRSGFKMAGDLSKASWYAYKLSASVGELRAKPSQENLGSLIETCKQLTKRLQLDTSNLVLAAEQYVKKPSEKGRMTLNDAAREVVAQIILRFSAPAREEERKEGG